MDSSSDASFAWTDASSDTTDSVSMVKANMNKAYSEDESVSGKSYKKKLQEELFVRSKQEREGAGRAGQAKRKWRGDQSESDEVRSPKKKKIKREPESDNDASTNRNKKNGINQSESHDSYDESYLDMKVKDEQHFAPPHPTKAKRSIDKSLSNSDILSESSESTHTKRNEKSKNHSISDNQSEDNTLNELVQEESEYNERFTKKKKKKSKKRKDSTLSDDAKPINVEERDDYDVPGTASASGGKHILPGARAKVDKKNCNLKEVVPNQLTSSNKTQNSVNQYENDSEKRKTRISERIQFEEENSDLDTSQFKTIESSNKSDKLKTYGKENLHLKPLKTTLDNNVAALTADDEIWLIRCPKDVHVDSFQDKILTMEGKCKLKLNGQTYEGIIDHEAGNMSLLSSEQSHFVIKSWLVKGFLNLRKRIPKTHIQDDIALNINQASFIPLPETKSRHPLFGYNYKKSLKLAARVTERLNTTTPSQYKKNKSQKEKSLNCEQDHFTMTRPKEERSNSIAKINDSEAELPETEQASSRKKNKHNKHRNQESAPKTKKKYKYDLESVEAWDSEKAIEENLFNF